MTEFLINYAVVAYMFMGIKLVSQKRHGEYDDVLLTFAPITGPLLILRSIALAISSRLNSTVDSFIYWTIDKLTGNTSPRWRYRLYCSTVKRMPYYQWCIMKKDTIQVKSKGYFDLSCLPDSIEEVQVVSKTIKTLRVCAVLPNLEVLLLDDIQCNNITGDLKNLPSLKTYSHDGCSGIVDLTHAPASLKHVCSLSGTATKLILPIETRIDYIQLPNHNITEVVIPQERSLTKGRLLQLTNNKITSFIDNHGYINLVTLMIEGTPLVNKEILSKYSIVKFLHC